MDAGELVDAAVMGVAEFVDAAEECVAEGLGDVCDVVLLLRLAAADALLEVDEIEDGSNIKPGLVTVVVSPSVMFKPKILNL